MLLIYTRAGKRLLAALPDLLQYGACPVLGLFAYSPPICRVHLLHALLEAPVPPVLGHFS